MELTQTANPPRMVPLAEIKSRLNRRSTTTIYADIRRGVLPPFVKVGDRGNSLPDAELAAIQCAHAAGADEDTIKLLVAKLVERREQRLAALKQEVAA
jgi:hypothetical protein